MNALAGAAPAAYDAVPRPGGLSAACATHQRPTARLPRQRRLHASGRSAVLDALNHYETQLHANVHRGVHTLSQLATDAFEAARERVRRFLNAASTREIVFVRGTTEAINLVAQSWGRSQLKPGDEILISALEHHANIVPWQMAAAATGARARASLRSMPTDSCAGMLSRPCSASAPAWSRWPMSRMHSAPYCRSRSIVAAAHRRGIPVLLDGAQAVAHEPVDVRALGCDFYAFSGHKIYAPTGIGVLYGREALLESMPPWQGGGDMIRTVSASRAAPGTTCRTSSRRARLTSVARSAWPRRSTIWNRWARRRVAAHEHAMLLAATGALSEIPGIRLHGTAPAQGCRGVVHARGRTSARPGHGARPRGRGDTRRPPLRDAADGPAGRTGHRARLLRLLQHAGGSARSWSAPCARHARYSPDGPDRALPRGDPRPQPAST